jgi:5-methylcytosine-specific restriction endonuclease McrA
MKTCRLCNESKEDDLMVKAANLCRECRRISRRTGRPRYTFPKGIVSTPTPFKKGNKPWTTGIEMPQEIKDKIRVAKIGVKQSKEHIEKCRLSRVRSGARKSYRYNEWALQVKQRDGFICQHCGIDEINNLQAHHVVPWEDSIELRFEVSNGLTLCRSCHTKEDRRIKPLIPWNKGKKLSEEHKIKLRKPKKRKA